MDDTMKWVIPAISLGYAVKDDPCGRLKFFNETCTIIYCNGWKLFDATDVIYEFESLDQALQSGADF